MWPFTKREDWRPALEWEWRTVSEAGEYVEQRYMRRQVRFPDGAERWVDDDRSPRVVKRFMQGVA